MMGQNPQGGEEVTFTACACTLRTSRPPFVAFLVPGSEDTDVELMWRNKGFFAAAKGRRSLTCKLDILSSPCGPPGRPFVLSLGTVQGRLAFGVS